ncbi:MAG: NUDIX hydrolase [bacterium]|nr:NUDIX hydrolase [bacterium]
MKKKFQIRVAGISFFHDKILLITHKKNGSEYWVVPGGRCEWSEPAADAVRREFKEELDLDVKVLEFLFYSESLPPSYPVHSLNLFFLVKPLSRRIKLEDNTIIGRSRFFTREEIKKILLYPKINSIIYENFNLWRKKVK